MSTPEDPESEMIWFGQRGAADAAAGWMSVIVMVMMVCLSQLSSTQLSSTERRMGDKFSWLVRTEEQDLVLVLSRQLSFIKSTPSCGLELAFLCSSLSSSVARFATGDR